MRSFFSAWYTCTDIIMIFYLFGQGFASFTFRNVVIDMKPNCHVEIPIVTEYIFFWSIILIVSIHLQRSEKFWWNPIYDELFIFLKSKGFNS